jgi:hypothetical protein
MDIEVRANAWSLTAAPLFIHRQIELLRFVHVRLLVLEIPRGAPFDRQLERPVKPVPLGLARGDRPRRRLARGQA